MLILEAPWWLAALPLPIVLALALPPVRQAMLTLRAPYVARLASATSGHLTASAMMARSSVVRWSFLAPCWGLICLSLARPVWLGDPIVREESARDLILVVDISQSMEAGDMVGADGLPATRFDVARAVLASFIDGREGDRIGLVVFGTLPFLQAPLTTDLNVVRTLFDEVAVGFAGPSTALGDAMGVATQAFANSLADEKTLLILTDGNDTASQIPPARAAEVVGRAGAVAYVVAFGDEAGVGEEAIDLATLERIAAETGGQVFQAQDRDALVAAYAEIDRLEPVLLDTTSWRPRSNLFFVPLAAFLVLVLAQQTVAASLSRFRKGPTDA